MENLAEYQGIGQFGRAWQVVFENDPHAPGSVDRVLMKRLVRLCADTAEYLYAAHTPLGIRYETGSRPELEQAVARATEGCLGPEEHAAGIARFCSHLGDGLSEDLDTMRVGGTEEDLIRRGTVECLDVARAACTLSQVAGIPARIALTVSLEEAYNGHVIIEAYRDGCWGAVDPLTDVIYRGPEGRPASLWDLMRDAALVERHWRGPSTLYTRPGQFGRVGVCNYFVWETGQYDYAVSGVNAYYRSILEMSAQGWPGGFRWLHGEDAVRGEPTRP